MKPFPAFSSSLALILALVSGVPGVSAQRYRLTDLGVIPGQQNSKGTAINAQGEVSGGSEFFASRYRNGTQENLGLLPGGIVSTAYAINSQGAVAGTSSYTDSGNIVQATLFQNGTATSLGTLPNGNYSFGRGINDSNVVVGYNAPNSSSTANYAFIWDAANGIRALGSLLGPGGYARALSINNASVVTGRSVSSAQFSAFHAFVWDKVNGMRDLGTLGDGGTSVGNFISQTGHVAGTSSINNFDNRTHAFLYDGSAMRDLGSLGGDDFYSDRSEGYGINSRDEVVGSTYRPYAGGGLYQVAFVYRNGQMLDLEKLVDASGVDYRLYVGNGINDAGQIVVNALQVSTNAIRTVVLTPNPEIASIKLVANRRIVLTGRGVPGQAHRVQTAAACNGTYATVDSVTPGADGTWQWEDPMARIPVQRFYRIAYP